MSKSSLAKKIKRPPASRFEELLIEEADIEIAEGTYLKSKRLSEKGKREFPSLLLQAAGYNDTQWLIQALQQPHLLWTREARKEEGNILRFRPMPKNAFQDLAVTQMNRLRLRAHCRLQLEQGQKQIKVPCRKRDMPWEMEMRTFETQVLLEDLRRQACQESLLY